MRTVFVLMPFRYDDLTSHYQDVIKRTIELCGWRCIRADENDDATFIISREVIRRIEVADIILADLTTLNPNVFYELGVAHAFGTNVLMISRRGQDIPFDLKDHRVFLYTDDDAGREKLRQYLTTSIRDLSWSQKANNPVYQHSSRLQHLLDFYAPDEEVTDNSSVARKVYQLISEGEPISYRSARAQHVVLVTGGVAVGKTTFSHLLKDTIASEEGDDAADVLSLDAYQMSRPEAMKKNAPNGYSRGYWRISDAVADIRRLVMEGETISHAPYDHRTGKHIAEKKLCHARKYLIVEGLAAFDSKFLDLSNFRIFIGGDDPRVEQNLRIRVAYHKRGYSLRNAILRSEDEFRGFISELRPKRHLASVVIKVSSDRWSYRIKERDDAF